MAFSSELPMDNSLAPYFIYRDTPPGQAYDPTAPLVFFPAKDSDELFDALRISFPLLKTHSERMREAVISYLIQERETEQLQATAVMPTESMNMPGDTTNTSPWEQSWPSMSSSSTSSFSSPETLDLATPNFDMSFDLSPQPQLSRQFSTATTATTPASVEPATPALENMTGVFSISESGQPKQRIRRKMTEAEKVEYRKRRMVKACEKCSKRKRKCVHNQPEMENLTAKQKVTKTKTSPPASKGKNVALSLQPEQDCMNFAGFNFDDTFATDMQLFDEYTNVFEDPAVELDFDSKRQFDHRIGMDGDASGRLSSDRAQRMTLAQNQWRGDEQQEWSLPDPTADGSHNSMARFQNTTGGQNVQSATSMNNANASEALKFDQIPVQADHLRADYHPHHLFSTINTRGHPQGVPENGRQQPTGNGMLWEHLRTGQVDATHTRHVHDAEGHASYVFDSAGRAGAGSSGVPARASLAQTVLQLSGTAKAVRAFGKLLKSNGPKRISLQLVSLASVANAIATSAASAKKQGLRLTGGGLLTAAGRTYAQPQHHRFLRDGDPLVISLGTGLSEPAAEGPLEGMTIGDYLRMKTNFSDMDAQMGRGGQALPSMIAPQTQQKKAGGYAPDASAADEVWLAPSPSSSAASPVSKDDLASTSVPGARGSPSLGEREAEAQDQGRLTFTLGEGPATATSPSSELYMLKRRIPKAMHSIVDRDSQGSGIPTPLLQTRTELESLQGLNTILSSDATNDVRSELQTPSSSPSTAPTPSTTAERHATRVQPAATPTQLAGQSDSQDNERAVLQTPAATNAEGTGALYEVRLRDTFRHRDHFGRLSASVTAGAESNRDQARESAHGGDGVGSGGADIGLALMAMGSLLLLASMAPRSTSLSLLVLAFCLPQPGRHKRTITRLWHFFGLVWSAMAVQCTLANSSWLSTLQSAIGHRGSSGGEAANERKKPFFWFDAAWPGTSGDVISRLRRAAMGRGTEPRCFADWGAWGRTCSVVARGVCG